MGSVSKMMRTFSLDLDRDVYISQTEIVLCTVAMKRNDEMKQIDDLSRGNTTRRDVLLSIMFPFLQEKVCLQQ